MIPEQKADLTTLEEQLQPSLTYQLDLVTGRIGRRIDGEDAIAQAVLKILFTERYSAVIYSSEYGVELDGLIGQDFGYVEAELERIITEALLVDDRVLGVSDFMITDKTSSSLSISFTVDTIIGELPVEQEVPLG